MGYMNDINTRSSYGMLVQYNIDLAYSKDKKLAQKARSNLAKLFKEEVPVFESSYGKILPQLNEINKKFAPSKKMEKFREIINKILNVIRAIFCCKNKEFVPKKINVNNLVKNHKPAQERELEELRAKMAKRKVMVDRGPERAKELDALKGKMLVRKGILGRLVGRNHNVQANGAKNIATREQELNDLRKEMKNDKTDLSEVLAITEAQINETTNRKARFWVRKYQAEQGLIGVVNNQEPWRPTRKVHNEIPQGIVAERRKQVEAQLRFDRQPQPIDHREEARDDILKAERTAKKQTLALQDAIKAGAEAIADRPLHEEAERLAAAYELGVLEQAL